ncbi:MAG TPA: SUF system NifU family Fe-S cluster assembly protein [Acidimicrobiales bacterium]|nr:SUF system NifU family Fe-S cluster assembly protein [Acidimicrobiales bacterium]
MAGLEDLYREIILDHYRSPRNRGELPAPPARRVEGFNPLCGDEVILYVDIDDSGRISDIKVDGQGCSISQSSASMMTTAVRGRTEAETRELIRAFKAMMSIHERDLDGNGESRPVTPGPSVDMGELEALRGVVKFPVRIKCATLSWNTLAQAFDAAGLEQARD